MTGNGTPAGKGVTLATKLPQPEYSPEIRKLRDSLHWGSQTRCQKGKPVLYSVDDPAGLDTRRKALYLQPIAEYLRMDYLLQFCVQSTKQGK